MKRQVGPWALIPARGGSKSIPKKNIIGLGGRPMMAYGIQAAKLANRFERIVCSTDDREIAAVAESLGIEIDWRPAALATDEAAVADVAREFLARHDTTPEVLALVQPTSPFLLPEHVTALLDAMAVRPDCNSGQTITPTIHNSHAWNQRLYEDGIVRFMFAEERRSAFNKQRKPTLFSFGNLVAVRPQALLAGMDFFAEPSVGVQVDWPYNLDVDSPNDLKLAEAMMHVGLIKLDYLQS
jgi:CMP-N-acetylneuraminic acid synthetase